MPCNTNSNKTDIFALAKWWKFFVLLVLGKHQILNSAVHVRRTLNI